MVNQHSELLDRLDEACAFIREKVADPPQLGIVAGSGLTALGDLVTGALRIPFGDIPHMPVPAVVGHAGELVMGTIEGVPVVVLSGRVHSYEGHPMSDCVFGVRILGRLGVERVLLTNAAGGITKPMYAGRLCRISDHINMSGQNPLIGPNIDALGPRFPDMTQVYDATLAQMLDHVAAEQSIDLGVGVYAMMRGPSYETPAEITLLRTVGAALVGMSTVPEAIALRHMGVTVGGVSVVSNQAAGLSGELLDHSEVKEVAGEVGPSLLSLISGLCRTIARTEKKVS